MLRLQRLMHPALTRRGLSSTPVQRWIRATTVMWDQHHGSPTTRMPNPFVLHPESTFHIPNEVWDQLPVDATNVLVEPQKAPTEQLDDAVGQIMSVAFKLRRHPGKQFWEYFHVADSSRDEIRRLLTSALNTATTAPTAAAHPGTAPVAQGRFSTHRGDADLAALRLQYPHVLYCTVCAQTSSADAYLCFDGDFEDMTDQLKRHYVDQTQLSDVVSAFAKAHCGCVAGCDQHTSPDAECPAWKLNCGRVAYCPPAAPAGPCRPSAISALASTLPEVQADGTMLSSHGNVDADVGVLNPIDALPNWLARMGIRDITACNVDFDGFPISVVVVNDYKHPKVASRAFWFTSGTNYLRVVTHVGLSRAVQPDSVVGSPARIRYRNTGERVWPPGTVPVVNDATINDPTEEAVRRFFHDDTLLYLNTQAFDSHAWYSNITSVEPPQFAISTADFPEDKRTVLCVSGESGIGKTKWVTDVLSKALNAVPVVATVESDLRSELNELDALTQTLLGDATYGKLRVASTRMLTELGRHSLTFAVSDALFRSASAYTERRALALKIATSLFDARLKKIAGPLPWAVWRDTKRDVVVNGKHVLLVIDEVGGNLNLARALLSDRYIQRTLKEELFGSRSMSLSQSGAKVPLNVDLVLCGTGADALSSSAALSSDPGSVRIVQLRPIAANTTAFGNALLASYTSRSDLDVAKLPLQQWVARILTNPRLAHAFAHELGVMIKRRRASNLNATDVRHAVDHAMETYADMNGVGKLTKATKDLLMDVAYRELTTTQYSAQKPSVYTGNLRVNWDDKELQGLFSRCAQAPSYDKVDHAKLRAALLKRPSSGITAIAEYDKEGARFPMYMALCLQCVSLGLMTFDEKANLFDASPALRFALCLRFGLTVSPSQSGAFEEVTLCAAQRGLEAQGYDTLQLELPVAVPQPNRDVSTLWFDGPLRQAWDHLQTASTTKPCAVVIKNGPAAPAADIIVLKRQHGTTVAAPNTPGVLPLGPDLQMMLIGCKHNNSLSWVNTLRMNAKAVPVRDRGLRLEAWRQKWCTLGISASSNHGEGLQRGRTAGLFFAHLLLSTVSTAPPDVALVKSVHTVYVLQESFTHDEYKRTTTEVLNSEATSVLPPDTTSSCHVCAREELGLFASLILETSKGKRMTIVSLPATQDGRPLCGVCSKNAGTAPFFVGLPNSPTTWTCGGLNCMATLDVEHCQNPIATQDQCCDLKWLSESGCAVCNRT